jgi:hypothetical protein
MKWIQERIITHPPLLLTGGGMARLRRRFVKTQPPHSYDRTRRNAAGNRQYLQWSYSPRAGKAAN